MDKFCYSIHHHDRTGNISIRKRNMATKYINIPPLPVHHMDLSLY